MDANTSLMDLAQRYGLRVKWSIFGAINESNDTEAHPAERRVVGRLRV
jgi:hypothetical protein